MSAVGTGMDGGPASALDLEQPRARGRAGRRLRRPHRRRDARQRRQPARLRGPLGAAAVARPRTTTPRPRVGPFIRFFDAGFTLDDVRSIDGHADGRRATDGFALDGSSSMAKIAAIRPISSAEMIGTHAPVSGRRRALSRHHVRADRGPRRAGHGLHPQGRRHRHDLRARARRARQPHGHADECAPWTFGAGALMRNLAKRGLMA